MHKSHLLDGEQRGSALEHDAMTIPIGVKVSPRLDVFYATRTPVGLIEHRVFLDDPRPGCALCDACKSHREDDGRYYCDRVVRSITDSPRCSA